MKFYDKVQVKVFAKTPYGDTGAIIKQLVYDRIHSCINCNNVKKCGKIDNCPLLNEIDNALVPQFAKNGTDTDSVMCDKTQENVRLKSYVADTEDQGEYFADIIAIKMAEYRAR